MQTLIFYSLLIVSAIGWFAFAFFSFWYWQREQRERTRIRQTKADIADIMLLFQTMRDVVVQQKQLASDFNAELDRKVGGVKQVLSAAIDKNERLYEKQRDLEREMNDMRAEVESLQRQVNYIPPAPPRAAEHQPTPRRRTPEPASADAPFMVLPGEVPAPEAVVLSEPEDPGAGPSLWEQVDLAVLNDNAVLDDAIEEDDLDEELPLAPADGDAARAAFRTLLDLSSRPTQDLLPAVDAEPQNGRKVNAALQQRILQYAEAGMAVADIARELGIGKGEVRLMLSLAKPGSS